MGAETPRAILLGMLKRERGLDSRRDRQACRRRAIRARSAERRRAQTARRRRLSAMRRRMSPAIIRNGSSRISRACLATTRAEEGAALSSRAPLDLRVNTLEGRARQGRGNAVRPQARADALVALGLAHSSCGRCQEPGDPCRAGIPQRHGRSAGRRLATCRAVFRRQARRAGGRSLRRRRRQDAGARGDDGEQGPDFRHRRRQAAAGADPRSPQALGRAQRAGAHAEIGRRRNRRSRRPHATWS